MEKKIIEITPKGFVYMSKNGTNIRDAYVVIGARDFEDDIFEVFYNNYVGSKIVCKDREIVCSNLTSFDKNGRRFRYCTGGGETATPYVGFWGADIPQELPEYVDVDVALECKGEENEILTLRIMLGQEYKSQFATEHKKFLKFLSDRNSEQIAKRQARSDLMASF